MDRAGDSAAAAYLESAISVALVRIDAAGSDRIELIEAMCALSQLQAQRYEPARSAA